MHAQWHADSLPAIYPAAPPRQESFTMARMLRRKTEEVCSERRGSLKPLRVKDLISKFDEVRRYLAASMKALEHNQGPESFDRFASAPDNGFLMSFDIDFHHVDAICGRGGVERQRPDFDCL